MIGDVPEQRFTRLRRYNLVMGALHAAQAVAILALATAFALPVTASFMTGAPGSAPADPVTLFDVSIAWGCALFLLLSAAAHFIIAAPGVFPWYRANLLQSRNYARWIEYSLSSSVMIVLIAMITGISDIAALVALFGVNVSMILFGLVQEKYEKPGGGHAAVLARLHRGHHAVDRDRHLSGEPRQRRRARQGSSTGSSSRCSCCSTPSPSTSGCSTARWASGATTSTARPSTSRLSLVAKSLLAWQVFAGTLMPAS